MNALEQQLSYPLGDALPSVGKTLEIAPGVRWVRMRLPFALDHINLWLLRDEIDGRDGWTIVDCGITSDETRSAWEQVFANELDALPVLRVIVTHMHPDHIGLAHWLTERWNCRLWMSATDFNAARLASASTTGVGGGGAAQFMRSHGLTDPESIEKIKARTNYYASMVPKVPDRFRRILDADSIPIGPAAAKVDWECIVGYGHAPEHMSLYCAELGILISGDMILPRISTNVSVIDLEPEGNPLPLFLASIDRMRALPQDTLVLPSHGRPFRGLHTRIAQLQSHHEHHFAELMNACADQPHSAADAIPVLFKRHLDLHQMTFAMGESIAHLNALWMEGRLIRTLDEDGIYRFAAA